MKNKFISACLLVSLLVPASVSAADVKISDGKREVTVSQQVGANEKATLIVVKSGGSLDNNDDIYAMEYTVADGSGKAVWTFDMIEKRGEVLSDGEYDLYIKTPSDAVGEPEKMTYSSLESRTWLLDELRKVKTSDDLGAIINNTSKKLILSGSGFDVDSYLNLTSYKSEIVINTFNYVGNFENVKVDTVAESFNKAIAVSGLREDGENTEKYLSLANMKYESTAYADIADAKLTEWLKARMNGAKVSTIEAMENEYKVMNILYILNNKRVSEISAALAQYATQLGIDDSTEYQQYRNLSSRSKADEAIVNRLKSSPVTDISALRSAISAGVTAAKSNNGGGGGGSSSGGGGGSVSSGGSNPSGSAIPVSPEKKLFTDLHEASWAAEAINKMAENGIVDGDGNGKFRPNDTMSREEFVKMIVIASGIYDKNAECSFDDCQSGAWYYRYIASAVNNGIVQGVTDTEFGIGQKLTRQDMAVLCGRAKGALTAVKNADLFADNDDISEYAKEIVYELCNAGVIDGMDDGTFRPLQTATRAQGATMIYNLFVR